MPGSVNIKAWKRTIRMIDAPVALMRHKNGVTEAIEISAGFAELIGMSRNPAGQALGRLAPEEYSHGPISFPDHPEWLLKTRLVDGDDLWLWQASRRIADTTSDLIASWVASASLGDIGLFFFDPEGKLRAYNSGIRNYFPRTEGFPVLGKPFREQLESITRLYDIEALQGREQAWIDDLVEGYESPGQPKLGPTPTGRWAISTTTVMGDGSRIQVMNDITEFRERDRQLKLFMRNARRILFSRRALEPGGKLQVWGDVSALVNEVSIQGEKVNSPGGWYQMIDPEDRDRYRTFMESIRPGHEPYSIEFRYRTSQSKRTRWMREIGWTIRDRDGRNYLDAIYFDITETKDTHKALIESEERFRHFTDLASDWYFEIDADFQITFLSDRYQSISGMPSVSILGTSFADLVKRHSNSVDGAERKQWHQLFEDWTARRPLRERMLKFRDEAGTLRTMETSADPRFDERGTFIGYRGIGRDLTALALAQDKAMESLAQAEKANTTKSSFIANVSHELRTPLNAILGFSSVMAEEVLGPMQNERYRRYAADIHQSGGHLLSLVNDLLDISRVEAGQYSIDDVDIDLHAETERVFALLLHQAKTRTLANECIADGPHIRGDRRALRQVLINLVANAIKFTDENGSIMVRLSRQTDGGICLSISDNGIGIEASELDRIFEPFGRAATHLAAEGTGLGLPLSRDLIELHDGRMEIRSEPGHGTSVDIILPAERVIKPPAVKTATG